MKLKIICHFRVPTKHYLVGFYSTQTQPVVQSRHLPEMNEINHFEASSVELSTKDYVDFSHDQIVRVHIGNDFCPTFFTIVFKTCSFFMSSEHLLVQVKTNTG